jgi:hypothetical protein
MDGACPAVSPTLLCLSRVETATICPRLEPAGVVAIKVHYSRPNERGGNRQALPLLQGAPRAAELFPFPETIA